MNKIIVLAVVISIGKFSFAQQKDKAEYIDYKNDFYNEILKSNNKELKVAKKTFKLNPEGKDLPKSVDEFKTVWCNNPLSQGNTGTCWCFSTSSFYESEIYRLTKKEIKLSELYTVYWEYIEKAREFIKTKGESFFGEGSETNAVARMMAIHGMVPAEAYIGKVTETKFHNHAPMFDEMKKVLNEMKTKGDWDETKGIQKITSILDAHIGKAPETITYDKKKMTPLEFMKNVAKINPDNYVNFMSLMEAPYYTKAAYDVPDNWWNSSDYFNVPLDDFINIIKNALQKGYSISIGGDVSEPGYLPLQDVAMIPSFDIPSEYIDENARQMRFNNGATTDDHAIHLIGYKETPKGWWFLIKDSGSGARNGKNKGYYFYHEDYIKLKMMTITLHKDAVSEEIWKKFKM